MLRKMRETHHFTWGKENTQGGERNKISSLRFKFGEEFLQLSIDTPINTLLTTDHLCDIMKLYNDISKGGVRVKKAISTKQALLFASIVWILCLSMFVGTTMSWFSDSVTSGSNVIQSGTLDARFEYRTDDSQNWASVTSASSLFSGNTGWVPGSSQTVYLRVTNTGTLPLRYTVGTVITSETYSTNVEGSAYKLSDYLIVSAVSVETGANAVSLTDAESTDAQSSASIGTSAVENRELAVGGYDIWSLTVALPDNSATASAANPAAGAEAPRIEFSVVLAAMQVSKDADGFAIENNGTTIVSTEAELRAALLKDGTVVLKNDITLLNGAVTVSGKTVLDLNGCTLLNNTALTASTDETSNKSSAPKFTDEQLKADSAILLSSGTLTVRDSSTGKTGKIYSKSIYAVYTAGTGASAVTLEGGSLDSGNNTALYLSNTAFTMSGGTVNGMALYSGCTAEISGGSVATSFVLSEGTLTVTGGSVTGSILLNGSNAVASISDGTFKGTVVLTGATLNISGGAFYGNFSITGGKLNISGGSFEKDFNVTRGISPVIKITGGRFAFDPISYTATGYAVISESEGTESENKIWIVVPATAGETTDQG